MEKGKIMEWILRIAVAGEFLGHGALALAGKADWVGWVQRFTNFDQGTALTVRKSE